MRLIKQNILWLALLLFSVSAQSQTFDLYSLLDFYNLSADEKDGYLTDLGFTYYGDEEFNYVQEEDGFVSGRAYHNTDTTEFVVFTEDIVEFQWRHTDAYLVKETNTKSVSYSLNLIFEKQIKKYRGSKVKKFDTEEGLNGLHGNVGDWEIVYDPVGDVVIW